MKCLHLLKIIKRAYKLYAKDTAEKMKADLTDICVIQMVMAKFRERNNVH